MARPREFDYDDVVEQAMYLFWRQGYQNTSIDDVESATGLTKGSLYKAFKNKRLRALLCMWRTCVPDD